jgi:hypothetical protein
MGWATSRSFWQSSNAAVFDPQFSTSNFFRREREIGATMAFGIGWLAKTLLAQSESPDDKAHQLHTIYMGPVSEADRAVPGSLRGDRALRDPRLTQCVPISLNPPGIIGGEASLGRPSDCV